MSAPPTSPHWRSTAIRRADGGDLLLALLARVAGDLALGFKATGGIYLAGGIAPRILPLADKATIHAVFAGKPPVEDLAARFALNVITADDPAEQGLAAIAAAPGRFGLDDPARLWFG
jgi:glucokinase